MNELQWFLFALTCIGAFNVGEWCRRQYMDAWRMLDEWSEHRAYLLCARAIVDYEFRRGVHIGEALRYAMKIVRGVA